jgi:hypothetical protein
MSEAEPRDPMDEYDAAHGKTTLADEQKPSGLTEAANHPPAQAVPFKVTGSNE